MQREACRKRACWLPAATMEEAEDDDDDDDDEHVF